MISVRSLAVTAGKFALRNISFDIPAGRHFILMGRTGTGKTTLLEAICGLRTPSAGAVIVNGIDVTAATPGERGIGYVPQDRALFTHMTVAENIGFSPAVRAWARERISARVNELAGWMEITPLLERMPAGLSGGEAQRVALARALAVEPSVLLLDEPLSALDEETHDDMCELLTRVRNYSRATILHVTHSRAEAAKLGDSLILLENGSVTEEPRT